MAEITYSESLAQNLCGKVVVITGTYKPTQNKTKQNKTALRLLGTLLF